MRIRTHDAVSLAFMLKRLKSHLRITANDLDEELMAKLTASIDSAEHFIGKIILKSDFIDTIPFSSIVTLSRPLISVDGIEVDDTAVADVNFEVDLFAATVTFSEQIDGKVAKVEYEAGMEQVPSDIVNAILLMASSLFANPMDSVETLPKASSMLLRPYRTYEL